MDFAVLAVNCVTEYHSKPLCENTASSTGLLGNLAESSVYPRTKFLLLYGRPIQYPPFIAYDDIITGQPLYWSRTSHVFDNQIPVRAPPTHKNHRISILSPFGFGQPAGVHLHHQLCEHTPGHSFLRTLVHRVLLVVVYLLVVYNKRTHPPGAAS